MTLEEARENVGAAVVYMPDTVAAEPGVILYTTVQYVMVKYPCGHGKATRAQDLEFA